MPWSQPHTKGCSSHDGWRFRNRGLDSASCFLNLEVSVLRLTCSRGDKVPLLGPELRACSSSARVSPNTSAWPLTCIWGGSTDRSEDETECKELGTCWQFLPGWGRGWAVLDVDVNLWYITLTAAPQSTALPRPPTYNHIALDGSWLGKRLGISISYRRENASCDLYPTPCHR